MFNLDISIDHIILDACTINNGDCGKNTICFHDSATYAVKCRCKTGYTNAGSSPTLNCTDSCNVNNGGCNTNAICSHDSATNVAICLCKPGYTNVGSSSNVICKGKFNVNQIERKTENRPTIVFFR